MNVHPLVSVCIQTYQHVHHIEQCLQSVLCQQTSFPFEIILGEDDSTDGTRDICIRYKEKFPNVVNLFLRDEKNKIWIEGEKTGRYNFISNLQAAKGKYIALLDGDDYWIDHLKLQKQVDFLESNPDYTLCFGNYRNLKNGKLKTTLYLHPRKKDYSINNIPLMHTGSVVFRNPGFDIIPLHFWQTPFLDFPLYMHVTGKGKIRRLPGYVVVYREHDKGMWTSKSPEQKYLKCNSVYKKMLPEYTSETKEFLCKKLEHNMLGLLRMYAKEKNIVKAQELARQIKEDDDLRHRSLLKKYINREWK